MRLCSRGACPRVPATCGDPSSAPTLGVGFGASGTVGDQDERDYRYGVIPEPLLGRRLILGERAMLEAQGRQYWIVGLDAGASANADKFGHE